MFFFLFFFKKSLPVSARHQPAEVSAPNYKSAAVQVYEQKFAIWNMAGKGRMPFCSTISTLIWHQDVFLWVQVGLYFITQKTKQNRVYRNSYGYLGFFFLVQVWNQNKQKVYLQTNQHTFNSKSPKHRQHWRILQIFFSLFLKKVKIRKKKSQLSKFLQNALLYLHSRVHTHCPWQRDTLFFPFIYTRWRMIIDYNADRKKESDNLLHLYQKENNE